MNYWIFKLSEQELYPDEPGKKYVYDNTHSVRVREGDIFIHLDKTKDYSFTATGRVQRITERKPTEKEQSRNDKVNRVFTAHLNDFYYFNEPFCIHHNLGAENRKRLDIVDVNKLGWSHSMARLSVEMYEKIIEQIEIKGLYPTQRKSSDSKKNHRVEDDWALTKKRAHLTDYKNEVKNRCQNKCVVCGLDIKELLDVSHISSYAIDKDNRANPDNGICLCKLCHKAFDSHLLKIFSDGTVKVNGNHILDFHAQQVSKEERIELIKHAKKFLDEKLSLSS